MRNAFARVITELAEKHKDIVLLAGDIGNRLFDEYKERYPDRFYNCGIAEAGMTGIASGLASCGLLPVTYTITPFNTIRCLEQIRLDVCYPNHPVIIVGVGSGLSYGPLGATHHSLEDIGCLRLLPNMHIVCPADPVEVELAIKDSIRLRRPTYIRLGKKGEPKVHAVAPEFTIGKAITIREGERIAILGVGNMVSVALEVADKLQEKNISPRVVSFHTIKPLDTKSVSEACQFSKLSKMEGMYGFEEATKNKFFRKGVKDSWKKDLDHNLRRKIEVVFKDEMQELGYL